MTDAPITTESAPQPMGGAGEVLADNAPATEQSFSERFGDAGEYVDSKGWKSEQDILESYRNLEKHIGADEKSLLRLPKDGDDLNEFYNKLGRPESADKYDFGEYQIPEGALDLTDNFREFAHKHGLTQQQAQGLFNDWNENLSGQLQSSHEQMQAASAQEIESLRSDWGSEYDANIEYGRAAARALELDSASIDSIAEALGTRKTVELMHKIGKGLGEDQAPHSKNQAASVKESAKAEWESLKNDPEFSKRLYDFGDKAAIDKRDQLMNIIYG
jgi:hypothetical protein